MRCVRLAVGSAMLFSRLRLLPVDEVGSADDHQQAVASSVVLRYVPIPATGRQICLV
jgi:hypothetical protein